MNRHQARQVALKALFQMNSSGANLNDAISFSAEGFGEDGEANEFVRLIVDAAIQNSDRYDQLIRPTLKGWELERLPLVDLYILHIALAEIESVRTPSGIVINEAVELAKTYSTEDSGRFVNGVLGTLSASFDEFKQ